MKNLLPILFLAFMSNISFAQSDDLPENTGDNFSLEGALALFKKSSSVEEFETLINNESSNVNNLDLNNDGQIDYVSVVDIQQNNAHILILSTYLSGTEKQDIATINIEKTGNDQATLQMIGDQDLYAENTIVEPFDTNETIIKIPVAKWSPRSKPSWISCPSVRRSPNNIARRVDKSNTWP